MTGAWYPPSAGAGQFLANPPFKMDIPNRDQQHGGMEAVGIVSRRIKLAMRSSLNWGELSDGHAEALDMIAHKIARILSGADPHDRQHWEDVAGYAQAAMRGEESQP